MLIIGREIGQSVIINDEMKVTVEQKNAKLHLVIDAPKDVSITRVKQTPMNMRKKTRIIGDTIQIGSSIQVSILQTESGLIRLAIDAPKEISVYREEIYQRKEAKL